MSVAEFGAENLLRPLSRIGLGLKGCEEWQVSPLAPLLCHPTADQLQGWPQLSLGQLIHQVMQFLAHHAHGRILRAAGLSAASRPRQAATALTVTSQSAPGSPGAEELSLTWSRSAVMPACGGM